ncbi:MAG: glycosyltransferase family 39 protein, partial [Anaerolineales bacterium]|nr:glycosyltransferase family 39 protein [Anaerolineales bacterium]
MIIVAGILIVFTSFLLAAILQIKTKPATLVAWYLLSFANIVLSGEIANIFSVLNRQAAFLLIHLGVMLVSLLLWQHRGKPHILSAFKNWKEEFKREKLLSLWKNWPELTLYMIGIAATFGLLAILIIIVPQNNNDSLSTHLSRVGYWLQFGSFLPWPTSRNFQLVYPINAQLQTFWSVLFTHSDKWVGFTQWIAALVTSAGIFGIARLLGWGRAPAALAGLTYLTYPLVVLQATTPQTDLVSAGLYVSAVYLLLQGIQENHRGALLLSALGISLGL